MTNPQTELDPLGLARCDENEVTWGGRVQYGPPGPGNRATGVRATLEPDMMGGKTRPRVNVPGYKKGGAWNKGHLLGAQLGGSKRDPRNFVAMHAYANSPVMRQVENDVRAAVDRGETITYSVTPVYRLIAMDAQCRESLRLLWDRGEPRPAELDQEGARLIPWAYEDEGGEVLYFLSTPGRKPDNWPILINEGRGPEWERHAGPCTSFLLGLLTGEVESEYFPDLPLDEHLFETNEEIFADE